MSWDSTIGDLLLWVWRLPIRWAVEGLVIAWLVIGGINMLAAALQMLIVKSREQPGLPEPSRDRIIDEARIFGGQALEEDPYEPFTLE